MATIDSTTPIEYRLIPGWPGYRVGNDGTAWSCIVQTREKNRRCIIRYDGEWKQLKPAMMKGHLVIGLHSKGKQVIKKVHRLVLEAFVGPCPEGMEGLHWDDDPLNNHVDNLRWGTPQDNADDRCRNGKQVRGEQTHSAKLEPDQIREIRAIYADGAANLRELAMLYGVSKSQVYRITKGEKWAHVV